MLILYTADPSGVSSVVPACSSETPAETEDLPPINIRISVFIDGTGNNLFNTGSRLHRMRRGRSVDGLEGSYENSFSNVSRLATSLRLENSDNNYHIPVYVEGMGTLHYVNDDWFMGSGMGIGDTGVISRVSSLVRRVRSMINTVRNGNNNIQNLKIDAFGFSRGAAAARYFVHRVLELDTDLTEQSLIYKLTAATARRGDGITIGNYEMPFIGLFDTVGSHRTSVIDGIDDDTAELHLDAIGHEKVKQVYQIAAADEHRMNFPLTNIDSAGSKGSEIFLPGVHSDIGGGYNNEEDSANGQVENNLPVFVNILVLISNSQSAIERLLNNRKTELINMGYYVDEPQVEIHPGVTRDELAINDYKLLATRTHISNKYSYIPLHMMADKAADKQLSFNLNSYRFTNDPFLVRVKRRVQNNRSSDWNWMRSGPGDPQLQQLRHNYCHFSSHFETTVDTYPMQPQMYNASLSDPWVSYENRDAVRRRRIYDG